MQNLQSCIMAFSKTMCQILVLHTKKVTENTLPVYATLDILQELFPFIVGSGDLLTLPRKMILTEM